MIYLVRVELPWACFGFEVTDGIVTRTAPITKWGRGWAGRELVAYWRRRGANVTWSKVNE